MKKLLLALTLLWPTWAAAQSIGPIPPSSLPPSGAAGGDLSGTYPNPTVTNGSHITNASIPNSGLATPAPCSAFGTTAGTCAQGGTITAGGPTGSATVAPIITYNAAGQLTTVSSATITPAIGSITGLGTGVATLLGGNASGTGGPAGTTSPSITTPTFVTSATGPLYIGGSGTTGTQLTLQTTSGSGTTDQFAFTGGSNGATTFGTWSSGNLNVASAGAASTPSLTVGNSTTGCYSVSTTGFGCSVNGTNRIDFGITNSGDVTLVNGTSYIDPGTGSQNTALHIVGRNSGTAKDGYILTDQSGNMQIAPSGGGVKIVGTNYTVDPGSGSNNASFSLVARNSGTAETTTFTNNQSAQLTIASGSGTLAVTGTMTISALTNVATTSAVCYNTGTGALTYDGTLGTCTVSTERVKHDIQAISNAKLLSGVLKMRPVSFEYDAKMNTPGQQLGLIAEDLASIDSRLVAFDNEGRPISIRFLGPMFSYLIGAVKEQQAEINELKQKVN